MPGAKGSSVAENSKASATSSALNTPTRCSSKASVACSLASASSSVLFSVRAPLRAAASSADCNAVLLACALPRSMAMPAIPSIANMPAAIMGRTTPFWYFDRGVRDLILSFLCMTYPFSIYKVLKTVFHLLA